MRTSTLLWWLLAVAILLSLSFAAGVYHEARSTRTELIAAQDKARKEGAAATKREYDKALEAAKDTAARAVREAAEQARKVTIKTVVRTIHDRPRDGRCVFTPEDMKDINAAGH